MKHLKSLIFVVLIAMFSFGTAIAADTVKIGLLAPLTGFAAADGLSVLNSVKLAVEKVNKKVVCLEKRLN